MQTLTLEEFKKKRAMGFEPTTSSLGILQSLILKTCQISSNDR